MNVYELRPGSREQEAGTSGTAPPPSPRSLYLLDLPGYGYARASQADRAGHRRLLRGVLRRPRLAGVVWLLDIRHQPSRDDLAMHAALDDAGVPVLAALTKADKVPRGQAARRRAAIEAALALSAEQVLVTSTRRRDGVADLRAAITARARNGLRENDDAATA